MIGLVAAVLAPPSAHAGTGRFAGGGFDYCISVRFKATAAQLQEIKNRFQRGSDVLLDATDNQHRYRTVYIANESRAASAAEAWVNMGTGGAVATYGEYGKRGKHINFYYASDFDAVNAAPQHNYTNAHEFGHHLYGLGDEYKKADGTLGGMCVANPMPNPATLSACLMDNYLTRGGMAANPTMNEFCVKSNHTTGNYQETRNHKSCWETMAAGRFAITAPANLPVQAAPASQAVTFPATSAQRRFIVIIDRSGSTEGGPLGVAKRAAVQFVKLLKNGDGLAVVDFDDTVKVTYPFTTINGNTQRNAAVAAINGIKSGRLTSIGDALLKGVTLLGALTEPSCQTVFVLFSDGLHNTGATPESAIPFIQAKLASVIAVAVGKDADGPRMQRLATQTGGKFFRVENAAGIEKALSEIGVDAADAGIFARAPSAVGTGGQVQVPGDVDGATTQATFILNWENVGDDLDLSLKDPSANTITRNDVGPGIEFISVPGGEMFVIDNPMAGQWTMVVDGISTSGTASFVADAFSDSTEVGVVTTTEVPEVTYPDPIHIEATPFFGRPVAGATVTGTVDRPDGSTAPVTLVDDGLPSSGDAEAGDGVYSALFTAYTEDGTYYFDLSAVNTTGTEAPGEQLGGPTSPASVAPFTRLALTAVFVSGIPAPPIAPVDHFQCYETRRVSFVRTGLQLVDQFGTGTAKISTATNICAPADKNGEDPSAPLHEAHLMDYVMRQTTPFAGEDEQRVVNQFGELILDVRKPSRLMVPSAKSLSGPPAPLTTEPDHFKCYKVRVTPKAPRFTPILGVQIVDQLGPHTIDILKPLRLCTPVDKNGESPGAEKHPEHLLCYRTRVNTFGTTTAFVENQFGPQQWSVLRRTDFCVPSLKNPMVTTTTTTPVTTTSSTTVSSPSGAFVSR